MKKKFWITLVICAFTSGGLYAVQPDPYIRFSVEQGYFPLYSSGKTPPLLSSAADFGGVKRAVDNLQLDIERVTGIKPERREAPAPGKIVLIGTLGKSPLIDQLVTAGKLDASAIAGKWEAFLIRVVENPFEGVDQALVVAGSDKRGTIFGTYDLSENIGVSPWYWWADVPVRRQSDVFVRPEAKVSTGPAVKYRGIFINDEQPALGGWVAQNYGGFKSRFYEKVFELILRMKGNFLWPAMWGQSFYTDDTLNAQLADDYGVVISTSHHEPLMRAHVEWKRNGGNAWNYQTNPEQLRQFWKEGIARMGSNESVVTLAMRGDGDEPMSEENNIKLLQRIVEDQRKIITETTGKPIEATPQVWALYKEVQDYYDKGMRVPDDVTLLLCDDNWGNIRKLPKAGEKLHPGGYGIYYHYDYVGGPRNYKWLNTNPIPRVWEQMNLAYHYNARKIWIVNVGDIKPMEFPIQFFLDYAWDPEAIPHNALQDYTQRWAAREFGPDHAEEIAAIMALYTKYNGRRKPELLGPDSFSPNLFSLTNYREAETVVKDYNDLATRAENVRQKLPKEYHDAYYQLILYPVTACANLNEFWYAVRLNHLYARQGRTDADTWAQRARTLFEKDASLSKYYNETMSGGKWNHMMDQHKIGYTGWHDDFKKNTLPELKSVTPVQKPSMGVVAEGSDVVWTAGKGDLALSFDRQGTQNKYVEIFNRGTGKFDYRISASPVLRVGAKKGTASSTQRIEIQVNWDAVKESQDLPVRIKATTGEETTIMVRLIDRKSPSVKSKTFKEADGYVSIEAAHFSRSVNAGTSRWEVLPDHGRTGSAIKVFPVTGTFEKGSGPHVEYDIHFNDTGKFTVQIYTSPTIDFTAGDGIEFGISLGDGAVQNLNLHASNTLRDWEESVKNSVHIVMTGIDVTTAGVHTLKLWAGDPGVVIQKIVIDTGGLKSSYLGPPESGSLD